MNTTLCDRCQRTIEPQKRRLLRTVEIRTEAYLRHLEDEYVTRPEICYDLCPDCKALFLDFMEGEAIPPCRKSPES